MANYYSYTNSGIDFKLKEFEGLYESAFNTKHISSSNYAKANEEGLEPFVNAVEIDWNSAIIGEG